MQGQSRPEPDSLLRRNQRKMKALLNELTTRERLHPTAVDGVNLSRADNGVPRTPVLYEPCICVLASGHKKGYVGSRCITYDENNYLVLAISSTPRTFTPTGRANRFSASLWRAIARVWSWPRNTPCLLRAQIRTRLETSARI